MSNVHHMAPAYNFETNRHKEIRAMKPDHKTQLDSWLVQGVSPSNCALRIKKGLKVFEDVADQTLKARVQRYYNDCILPNLLSSRATGSVDNQDVVHLGIPQARVNGYKVLEDSLLMQLKRIDKLYAQEEKMPTTMSEVRRELELLNKLSRDLNYMQLELGIHQRRTPSLHVNATDETTGGKMVTDTGKEINLDAVKAMKDLLSSAIEDDSKLQDIANGVVDAEFIEVEDEDPTKKG